jgi:hypothetical protein
MGSDRVQLPTAFVSLPAHFYGANVEDLPACGLPLSAN